jgi:hypothetical protein
VLEGEQEAVNQFPMLTAGVPNETSARPLGSHGAAARASSHPGPSSIGIALPSRNSAVSTKPRGEGAAVRIFSGWTIYLSDAVRIAGTPREIGHKPRGMRR